jgi:hypothetical protein
MKKTIVYLSLSSLFSLAAYSHIKPNLYFGKDNFKNVCSFEIEKTFYENNFKHPLLERIPVKNINIDGINFPETNFALAHPPLVEISLGQVQFNHDLFTQIIPTPNGANAIILEKSEIKVDGANLPKKLIVLIDHYQDRNLNKKFDCIID